MLECAIPEHLHKERTCPVSTPPNYVPPFPAYCARFPTKMDELVMAVIGAQYASVAGNDGTAISKLQDFVNKALESKRPSFWEVASVVDKRGAYSIAVIAYWRSADVHKKWQQESGFDTWWQSPDREQDGHGWFQEVLRPTIDRFETVFSNPENPEGAANMQERISGEMEEHAYWGSMRDRLAAAQDNRLVGAKLSSANSSANGSPVSDNVPKRVRVPGKPNLCVIRSGQDWSDTLPEERNLYLNTMHPVLMEGMRFLRDEGREIGCYAMNLWDVVDSRSFSANRERTFGLGYFDDLASLEYWSKSHQTHINIFGGFLMYAKKLNNVLSLRLFHEVYVLEPNQQFFEYIGCHSETSMMNAH
ncbi:aldoxime dehydratase [Alternaria alternata]|nr:aldoxime dehydratase [Alternaria alternata]